MKKPILVALVIAVILALIPVFQWNWREHELPPPADHPQPAIAPAPAEIEPEIQSAIPAEQAVVDEPSAPAPPPLPELNQSDSLVLKAFTELIKNPAILDLFFTDRIIERFVITVDNLMGPAIPARHNVVKPVAGKFLTWQSGENRWLIDPENYRRYDIYINLLENINADELTALYVRYYPLCQKAYEQLGYPNKYFNDRLIEVLSHLIGTPEETAPLVLVRPKVNYKYEDQRLEKLSAGQKIILRMGPENGARIRILLSKLRDRVIAISGDGS